METENNIKVAIRIRPQVPKEIIDMCNVCTSVTPDEPQVWLGKDKAFTFDNVFDIDSQQGPVYELCVKGLIEGCFEGYNATVLAYGQTGSGKTYTMGTGLDIEGNGYEKGIIPRAVDHLFDGIKKRQQEARDGGYAVPEFQVNAQFLELYNEDVIDLLAEERTKHSQIKIREDADGGMYLMGGTTRAVKSIDEAIKLLKLGAVSRTTGSTQMNAQSSRSHAIFTLHIKQQRVVLINSLPEEDDCDGENKENQVNGSGLAPQEFETLTAKFHFVDLAGSERLKRTGATGERAKEGISINSGLLALGNVISALGDKSKRAQHVPYRDSKLTRLLQDSLGGNSRTLMIACISPSDRDFMETLNTLRYANRAKNIKNRATANQDKSSQTINVLRRQIQQLTLELMDYKQGKRLIGEDGSERVNDMYHENTLLQTEINNLKMRVKAMQDTNARLSERNAELLAEKELGGWITPGDAKSDIAEIVTRYLKEIEELRTKLIEAEETCSQLRKQASRSRMSMSPHVHNAIAIAGNYDIREENEGESANEVLRAAKKDVAKMKRRRNLFNEKEQDAEHQDKNGNEVADDDNNSLNGGDGDDGSDGSSDDSDDEIPDNTSEVALYELSNEITVKERLILELEKSQRKMNTMKQHYEDKLVQLQVKINEIESERDKVLSKLGGAGQQSNEKSKKVREDYEKKLNSLQSEMSKLRNAKREHERAMKNTAQFEHQVKQLKNEVDEMKKQKVRLVKQMKEETQKHREVEIKNNRQIAQLSKQDRLNAVKIRSLEVEKSRFKGLLKRKDEEVNALKKRPAKTMSDRVAGRVPRPQLPAHSLRAPEQPFSPKAAKQKWARLEQNISKLVLTKQNILTHEQQMERFLHQRDQISHSLDRAHKKYERACKENDTEQITALLDEMEGLEENMKYLNSNINECQSIIVQMEDSKEDSEGIDLATFAYQAPPDEIKYILEKVLTMAINSRMTAMQREEEKREYELKYQQLNSSSLIQEQLLHHVLETTFIGEPNMEGFSPEEFPGNGFDLDARSHSTHHIENRPPPLLNVSPQTRSEKARRMTKTPQELLFETSSTSIPEAVRDRSSLRHDPMTQSLMNPASFMGGELHRVPSAPSLKDNPNHKMPKSESASPSLNRKLLDRNMLESRRLNKTTTNLSAAALPNPLISTGQPQSYISRQISMEITDTTPPTSPSVSRRNRDENVFSRLTSSTTASSVVNPDRGVIGPFTGKMQFDKNSPLVCSHIAEGHSRAVLSVSATNDVLFSGSKDCTAKIWDLHTGNEIQSMSDHPDAVTIVRYNEYNRLAFSVSKSYIKVWDPRDNPARCIKTLNSSGLVSQNGAVAGQKGNEMNHGEQKIFDIQLSPYGTTLFSTCGHIVRSWDLRMFYCVGKLNTGHQANIICMAVEEAGVDNNIVVTGSKDHYIKVFEVMEGIGGIHNPRMTLNPPHYDGIEALKIHQDFLFSASRDACIKKWDLSSQRLVQSLNQAHKDWIQSLAIMPNSNTLISGCRTGFLKLWSTDTCHPVGDIKAHGASINSIDTNSSLVFTASGDNTIGLWRWRSSTDSSPENMDYPE